MIAVLVGIGISYAGTLTPPGSPSKTMKSLSDLYQLINTGANTPSTDFTTPATVSSTMNSLGDIYDLMTTKIAAIDETKILTGTSIFGKAGSASAGGLPKTNQTGCWDATGATITCTDGGTALGGQDGYYQKGIAPAYTDNSDGTITDNATGLMWKKCTQGLTGATCATGVVTRENWTQALADCEADTTGGYTDWRLPNIREITSIVDYDRLAPAINNLFNAQNYIYWSSTTYQDTGGQSLAWYVDFYDGDTYGRDKATNWDVRCVR